MLMESIYAAMLFISTIDAHKLFHKTLEVIRIRASEWAQAWKAMKLSSKPPDFSAPVSTNCSRRI
jgi:hypothetical protein